MGILPDPISPDSYHILADSDMTNICCLFVFLVFYYSTMVNQYCSPPFGEYVYSNHLKQVQANKNDTHNYIYTWLTLICISKFTLVTFKHQSLHVFKLKTNIVYVYMLTNVYIWWKLSFATNEFSTEFPPPKFASGIVLSKLASRDVFLRWSLRVWFQQRSQSLHPTVGLFDTGWGVPTS